MHYVMLNVSRPRVFFLKKKIFYWFSYKKNDE